MLLGKIEIGFAKIFRLQTGVDITFKRQNRLASVRRGEIRVPLVKAGRVKIGQLVADAHQRGDLRRREPTRFADQLLRVVQQFRLGIALGGERALVVERFCR